MNGKEARFCTGCWRLLLLSSILVLHLIPLFVHGNTLGANLTELDTTANVTSLPSKVEEAAKVNDVVTKVTWISTSVSPIFTVTQRPGHMPRSEEEQGSGMLGEGVLPAEEEVVAPPRISPDSAETELLLPSNPRGTEEEDDEEEHTDPPWLNARDNVFDLDHHFQEGVANLATTTAPPLAAANPSRPDVLTVDFFDPASRGRGLDLAPPSPSSLAHELQGGDPTSWAMPDNYDYLTPYEDGASPTPDEYSYSTTTDTLDGDDDLRLTAGPPSRSRPRAPPGSGSFTPDKSLPSGGAAAAPEGPAAAPPALPVDGSDGAGGCRQGYVKQNGTCRSPCDTLPSYCFNGGQCYLLDGMGVFCRCNVQDYIWHKGSRCESVVTEFQVLCLTIGASALMVLLLFMIIVCFAKKLHVLKTENSKLRKRSSKYRPPSEQHNDNFSLSTIAEGSHPNVRKLCDTPPNVPHARALAYYDNIICQDDPNAQNKLEDPVKAPVPKEDDSLNIHNSLTPKHENHKVLGEENSSEVNSLQNNMM
ncbi:chondroitin sulfate proteoglycan 5-like isoform X1 [Oncorhynchus nerka]|uniref:chondroitin sulfate proteoglycan 5-like isoform X1 n=1 Tax=Oncorhynchus nerka TaxID=8023 RepID=UPI001131F966|nr:chondroitin sulfate proteoglycan 5-like isoform X1 [Oncorhynchus nerka]